jgi:hypothetical protein
MNSDDLLRKLYAQKAVLESTATAERVGFVACNTVAGLHQQRIFDEGKATDGSSIGNYSQTPIYVNPKKVQRGSVRRAGLGSPKGKTGRTVFASSQKPHKTVYFGAGYSGFRNAVGRQTAKVDLNLTGASAASLKVVRKGRTYAYGFTNRERMNILKGNEKRFAKTILQTSEKEKRMGARAAKQEIERILQEIR